MYFQKLKDLGIELKNTRGQQKVVCPKCSPTRKNKRDPCLSVNVNTGDYNCHNNCGFRGTVRSDFKDVQKREYKKPSPDELKNRSLSEGVMAFFAARGIHKETVDKFMIFSREEWMPQINGKTNVIAFPYIDEKYTLTNIKFRDKQKNFKLVKDAKLIPFNLQSINGKSFVLLAEGEIDAMTFYQCGVGKDYTLVDEGTGEVKNDTNHRLGKWAVMSVPNGASLGNNAKLEYIDNCAELFVGIDEFIIATDGDDAGNALKEELIRRLGVEKCRTINYPKEAVVPIAGSEMKRPCKDANEVLFYYGIDGVQNLVINSELTPVEGIYYVENISDSMIESFLKGVQLAPTTRFDEIDEYFRWKKGDINLWTGYSNQGKTTMFLQMALTKSIYDGWRWAIFSPENYPANDFFDDLIEMYCGKWLQLITKEEYINALNFLNEYFYYVYPENDHDLYSIHEKFRYLILKYGVDGVLIDPWNQLDHTQKPMQREDQYLSQQLKDCKRFALMNAVSYNIIAHPKNPTYKEDRSLPVPDMYDLHGGSMWGNKADQILSYYRPNAHVDKNDPNVQLHVQKVKRKRTGGKLGYVDLMLDWSKKRYVSGDKIYCDPQRAKEILAQQERNEYTQQVITYNEGFGSEVYGANPIDDEQPPF